MYPNNTSDVQVPEPSMPLENGCAPGYLPLTLGDRQQGDHLRRALPAGADLVQCDDPGRRGQPVHLRRRGRWRNTRVPLLVVPGGHEGHLFPDAFSNTLGYCIDYSKYIDPYKPGSTALPQPSCTALSTTAHTYDAIVNDAQFWGCQPYPTK